MIRLTAVIEVEGQGPRALTHESDARVVVLGRDGSADFQIPLATISRQHARITLTDNVYVIEDLGSTHGTHVNGRRLEKGEKKVLRHGDLVELTKAKITASIEEEKAVAIDPNEGTQTLAARAVQGILGRLGEAQSEGPFLRVLTGANEGARLLLSGTVGEWTLGRSKDCELVLGDPNVSRRHARVKRDWNGFTLYDLSSKNGVLVNDRLIHKPRRLKDRDEITVGPVKLVFVDPDASLLEALKDVPGFQIDEPDPSEEEAAALMDAPDMPAAVVGASAGEDVTAAPKVVGVAASAAESEPDLTGIDPELLEPVRSKLPVDWIILGGAGALVIAVIAAL